LRDVKRRRRRKNWRKNVIVEVNMEFYKGKLPVVCMERCIYDLIIGNGITSMAAKGMRWSRVKQKEPREW